MVRHHDVHDEVIDFLTQPITDRHQFILTEEHIQKGICSASDCHWPIGGWCVGCRAKLCHDHLAEHRNLHARAYVRGEKWSNNHE